MSQIGSFPQVGVKTKKKWNHHPVILVSKKADFPHTVETTMKNKKLQA